MSIEATTVVTFGEGVSSQTDYLFTIEIDKLFNLDPDGNIKSTFDPDDGPVYLAVNKTSNVTITAVVSTDGSIQSVGNETRSEQQQNLFASRDQNDIDTLQLAHAFASLSYSYLGRQGNVSSSTSSIGQVTLTPAISLTPFMADISISYPVVIYKLNPPEGLNLGEEDTYNIGVVFYITVN